MSKLVKEMIRKQLTGRLEGVTSVAVVDLSGIDAVTTNEIRGRLLAKNIHINVVKNSLAKQAFKEVGLEMVAGLLTGPCALAYGADSIVSVVRELYDIAKDVKQLTVKGALLDGDLFGAERIDELSKFPTRDEAIAQVVTAVLSAGANLSACIIAPGGQIASVLKTLEERGGEDQAEESAPSEEVAAEADPAEAVEQAPAAKTDVAEAPAESAEDGPAEE